MMYNGYRMIKKNNQRTWARPIQTKPTQPIHPSHRESNVIKAGTGAFGIRVPEYNNPFKQQPQRSWWIRGWRAAEQRFFTREQNSKRVQDTIELEEVEA